MFNLDSMIVLAYLLSTLIIGIYKGLNVKTVREYAIGDYKFADSTLIATTTATWIGAAALIGLHENIYKFGMVWFVIFSGGVPAILIFCKMSPGLIKFKGCLSIAEVLGAWYGKKARIISGLCVALYSIGIIGTQIAAIGYLFDTFFNIPAQYGILLSAGIVVLYSSFGGIKSVTYTDVIQFAFFVVAIPIIASTIFAKAGGALEIIKKIPVEHLKLFPNYGSKTEYIILFIYFVIPFCDACLVQRVLMAKDREQIIKSFKSTAVIMATFYFICFIIALSALAIDASLDPNKVLYEVIKTQLPTGIKGLGIAGALAVIMSTADSYLNVSSVVIVNDVVNPLRDKNPLTAEQELSVAKITTFIIGIAAIYFSTTSSSITALVLKTWIVWAPIVVVPIYAAILGIRSNFKAFAFGAIAGAFLVLIWNIFDLEAKTGIDNSVPAIFCNLVAFSITTYYYTKHKPMELYVPRLKYTI